VPALWGGPPDPKAIVISASGSDSNACSLSAPCATLEKAQEIARESTNKKIYLRAGIYNRTAMLTLTSADNGETWSTYPGDPVDSAILDASGMTGSNTSNNNIILIQGGSNITINGLQLQNFPLWGGITVHGGPAYFDYAYQGGQAYQSAGPAHGNTIKNNIVHNLGTSADNTPPFDNFAGIGAWGDVQDTTIANNAVYDVGGVAIAVGVLQMGPKKGANNVVVENNVCYNLNTASGAGDTGGIYFIDRTSSSAGWVIKNNFIRDTGPISSSTKAIYLDDNASNVVVTGNVVTGLSSFAFQFHSGSNNQASHNIIDLGGSGNQFLIEYQNQGPAGGMTGNTFTNNIVVAKFGGSGSTGDVFYSGDGNAFTNLLVQNNIYWNYSSGSIPISGGIMDSSPVVVNPRMSGWLYSISVNSPVFVAPVNFTPITGNWGPPGYLIPHSGTAPSQFE
jgi:hypothetical protein